MNVTWTEFLPYGIDMAPLGLEQRTGESTYFCTPKGARILGWAGTDGIHYCLVPGFGETVFAVSPMNLAPHYVHPVARTCSDFLRLLLACGSCAPLEQAWQWDEAQFQAFLAENPPTRTQRRVLEQLTAATGLSPMEHPWQYLHELQTGFPYDKIKYTEAYDDLVVNPNEPQTPPEWEVSFDGGFWGSHRGRPGKERSIRKEFNWAGYHWIIPSVYCCGKGVVVDFCMQVEPSEIRSFMEKWSLTPETEGTRQFTQEQQMQLDLDNPLHMEFHSLLHVNGKELYATHGYGTSYNPCLGPGYGMEDEAKRVIEHYGLDLTHAWVILRSSYPWATKRKPALRSLSVTMISDNVAIPGPHIRSCTPGETLSFSYRGQTHRLTVQSYEAQTMDWSHLPETGLEHPNHYGTLGYTVTPELPDGVLALADCDQGDQPRPVPSAPGHPQADSCAMAVGIIGGADSLVAVQTDSHQPGTLHMACSSLYFEPVEQVEWRMVFYEKPAADVTIDLVAP